MKGKRNCFLCGGEGTYKESGDAHRSGGIVPCRHDPDAPKKPVNLKNPFNKKKERCNCDASCGENRYHDLGSPGCIYREPEEFFANLMAKQVIKTASYNNSNDKIKIPSEVDRDTPDDWQMVLRVDEAIKVNEDYKKLQEDNTRMKKALNRIIAETKDPDAIRFALIGLNFEEK